MLTDAYLDEERYDILIYNIQNPNAPDYELESRMMMALMQWEGILSHAVYGGTTYLENGGIDAR